MGIDHLRFGIIGASVSLVTTIVVTLVTPEPDAETQKMVDEMRIPMGKAIIDQEH